MIKVENAMVLAAGLGLRMRPITDKIPKPLVELGGVPLIDRALDLLVVSGVKKAVVNLHYLGGMIEAHLQRRKAPKIEFSKEEDQLLDTGGAVSQALPMLGEDPFFVVNADIAWTDSGIPALNRLRKAWDDRAMDALLMLHPVSSATGYDGTGDYTITEAGQLSRRSAQSRAPYVFTGLQILHTGLFRGSRPKKFPMTELYDQAQYKDRLKGLVHVGDWHHIGTPAGLTEAEKYFAGSQTNYV